MDCKKLILYFGLTTPVIGVRECLHDWQEGDVITTDGAKTEIYAKFDSTTENMNVLAAMFKELNTNTSSGLKFFVPEENDVTDYYDIHDLLERMVCNQWTVKKRQWSDYEKRLDYMEECVTNIV